MTRLRKYNQYVQIRCDSCGGVGRFLNDGADLTRRRWKAVGGRHFCPRPACAAAAVQEDPAADKVRTRDLILALDGVYNAFRTPFHATFGVPLKTFWDRVMGFDVTAFDDRVANSNGGEVYAALKEKWGKNAARLVKELVAAEKRAVDSAAKFV